jgi:hypothetical protein
MVNIFMSIAPGSANGPLLTHPAGLTESASLAKTASLTKSAWLAEAPVLTGNTRLARPASRGAVQALQRLRAAA